MKITRPAIATVVAIAIAAGAVPATTHLAAAPLSEPQVSFPQNKFVPAVDETAVDSLEPAPTDAEPALDAPVADADAPEVPAANNPAQALEKITEQVQQEQTATTEELTNTPIKLAGTVAPTPTTLTEAPVAQNGEAQLWFGKVKTAKDWEAVSVHSPSMSRNIPLAVRYATDAQGNRVAGAPTVYLLNGAGGSEQNTDWIAKNFSNDAGTGVEDVFGAQGVNVVIPMEGAFSYYVNWLNEPQQNIFYKGKQNWATFLGEELPGSVEPYLGANNKRAIVGFSMSATSSLLLAEQYPDLYDAVGSFSGCAATSTPIPWYATQLTLDRGGATPEQVWGPMGSDYNRFNDALVNAEKLRGTALYISNGSGLGGESDMSAKAGVAGAFTLQVEGGIIEAMTNSCTHDLRAKLGSLNIPATFKFRNTGTHSWPYWKDDLRESWDGVIKGALS
ncbi:alpha/beta hydrolase [Corynebacterium sp.]|uniref:alpha/beta hydrolase n=1 Tax=Corynebacterium sp. TaxID=1720 RepID=UPI002A910722|nr:alpha/beta hydrolase-fold protein [Corynebacterium sp.]MDY5786057.1 alpha/beta hydrolase-fold protein [Corynebacterium sp.]